MARIPDDDIARVKRDTDLLALVRSRGIELRKHGAKDFVGRCPFHDDNDSPNFIVSPAKGLFHCMACGAAGNPIQFVEKFEGVSFRHAFELLNGGKAAFENAPSKPVKQATVPKLPCPLDLDADDGTLLDQVAGYYHERLQHNRPALDYLAGRGLDDEELVRRFRIGFADRTLGLRLPGKNRREGAAIRERLQELGVFRKESGHEHFNGNGHVAEIYGRKITKGLRKGTPNHLYLPGAHHGIFNPDALKSPEIILCGSVIDAFVVTDAAVHGSRALEALLEAGDPKTRTDSACAGKACGAAFAAKQVEGEATGRACRNKQPTARRRKRTLAKPKIRVRAGHVFATMKMSTRGAWSRCVGRARNEAAAAMTNLAHNMVRIGQIERSGLRGW